MSNSIELKYLKRISLEIEDELRWGDPLDWKNSSYLELSNLIKRRSGVRISADTLKRIFGKVKTIEEYNPQLATKDALAVFAGYAEWSDYKLKNPLPSEALVVLEDKPQTVIKLPRRNFSWIKYPILLSAVFLLIFFWPKNRKIESYEFDIAGKYLTGNAYHTTVFEYDVSQIETDSIFMDFGDNSPKVVLNKEKNTISHYYRGPGLYTANLVVDNQSVFDTTVYLSTKGWEAYTFFWRTDHTEYLPIYDFLDTLDYSMSIDPDMPRNKGIDTTQMYWVQYVNYQDFQIDGENFILEAALKNDKEIIPARCNHVKVHVIGENGVIEIYFLREGCSNWVNLQFGEVNLQGSDQDLSAFGKDFLEFQNVRIESYDKNVSVLYNDSLLHKQTYQQPLGKIKGIAFIFSGVGGAVKNPTIVKYDNQEQ